MQDLWTAVDAYLESHLIPADPILDAVQANSLQQGLPEHHVAPNQGKLLMLLAQLHGAKRILEIGTLGGYSTIWLARALPADGTLITLEYETKHATVAQQNIAYAGLADRVQVRVGAAADSLAQLAAEGAPAFDMVFIDADKINNTVYLGWALKLTRQGSLIIVDNVVRDGDVINADSDHPSVTGTRAVIDMMANEPRLDVTAVQTVGSKGYDGFALARVVS